MISREFKGHGLIDTHAFQERLPPFAPDGIHDPVCRSRFRTHDSRLVDPWRVLSRSRECHCVSRSRISRVRTNCIPIAAGLTWFFFSPQRKVLDEVELVAAVSRLERSFIARYSRRTLSNSWFPGENGCALSTIACKYICAMTRVDWYFRSRM